MHIFLNRLVVLLLLPILAPFLLFFAILIPLIYGFSPFYITTRLGKNRKPMKLYKFQRMYPPKPEDDLLDPEDDKKRMTRLGRILGDHGWDELPQLLSILKGEMAFIGPRPLMQQMYEKMLRDFSNKNDVIESWWEKRHTVLPGLSGWHQVNLADHNIIKFDMEYLESPSLAKKLKITLVSMAILVFGKSRVFKQEIPDTYEYEI